MIQSFHNQGLEINKKAIEILERYIEDIKSGKIQVVEIAPPFSELSYYDQEIQPIPFSSQRCRWIDRGERSIPKIEFILRA